MYSSTSISFEQLERILRPCEVGNLFPANPVCICYKYNFNVIVLNNYAYRVIPWVMNVSAKEYFS